MKKAGSVFLNLVLMAGVSFGVSSLVVQYGGAFAGKNESRRAEARETAYQRVMRTGVLRCGYLQYPTVFEKDPNTGRFSGMYYDVLEEMGKELSLKVEWTEEIGFATAFDGLKAQRYDAVCVPLTPTPGRAREALFSAPIVYGPFFFYARAKDFRFDNAYARADDPAVKIAVLEGEMSQNVKQETFPKSQSVLLPHTSDVSQVLLQVTTGKADLAMTEPTNTEGFITKNPGTLRRVEGPPLRVNSAGVAVAVGEHDLVALLNVAIQSLHRTEFIKRSIEKIVTAPYQIYLPAQPWGETAQPVR